MKALQKKTNNDPREDDCLRTERGGKAEKKI